MDRRAYNPNLSVDWEHLIGPSPLSGGFSSWTDDYTSAAPTANWAGETQTPFDYSLTSRANSIPREEYAPGYGEYSATFDPLSSYSSGLIGARLNKWVSDTYPQYDEFGNPTNVLGLTGGGGDVSQNPNFGQFHKDPTVYREIEAAAAKYGVPTNLLKVMIARESSGDWQANSHATYLASRGERIVGYTGIMESTARAWGYNFDSLVGNRALQIDAMANGLQRLYSSVGAQYGWDGVISTYYSGKPDQSYTPPDSFQYGTTAEYVADVKKWWAQEDAWTRANGGVLGGTGGGTGGGSGQVLPESAIWGNLPGVTVTQGNMEVNDWVLRNTSRKYGGLKDGPGMYDYAVKQFGQMGHPGIDYGMPYGTPIYTPVGGTVTHAGTGWYGDDRGGIGEIRVRLDNGHDLIFGHMASGNVRVGSRINAGDLIGSSGTAGSGQHLHLEYRVPDPTTPSGWASVDPNLLTTGGMTVGAGIGGGWMNQGQVQGPRSMSFQDMVIANMQGRLNIGGTKQMSSGNSWNDWLYDTLRS